MTPSRLQQALKKKRPFDSPEHEANLNILRTSDQFEIRIARLLREYNLTPSQYNVLRILRGAGQALPSSEIADRLLQVVPAITGLIDRLEKQGLVSRKRCTKDRRVIYVGITEKALEIIREIDAPLANLHHQLTGHLTSEELSELSRLLEKARASVEDGNL
jgi:DNA-binding MarR family transcriptional regulator